MKRFPFSFLLLLAFMLSNFGAHNSYAQWIQQRSGTRAKLNDVVMLDSLKAIAVGDLGAILKTTNAGQTWRPKPWIPIPRPMPPVWNAIAFGSPTVGVVVGNRLSGAITTDAGETWRNLFITGMPLPVRNLVSVAFVGENGIYIGTDSVFVLFSPNGGLSWGIYHFTHSPISDIFFSTGPSIFGPLGYAITPQRAYRTTNLGATWRPDSLPIPPLSEIRRGDISEDANAYAVGFMGDFTTTPLILYRNSVDTAWRQWMYMPPLPVGWLNDVSAPASRVAYACGTIPMRCASCGNNGLLFKTTDAGHLWRSDFGFRRGLNAIDFLNERRGFVVGDSGAIFFTPNGGGRVIHAFRLLYPRDGDTLRVGSTFRYQWERASDLDSDTTWHQLFVSTDGPDGPWNSYQSGTVDTITAPLPAPPQGQYWWMVRAMDGMNMVTCEEVFSFVTRTTLDVTPPETPLAFALHQNYPNPFNPTTRIEYDLPKNSFVQLKIFNLLAQQVATLVNGVEEAGRKSIEFDASNLSSGVYIYQLQAVGFTKTMKMLVTK